MSFDCLKVCAIFAFFTAVVFAFVNSYLYDWPTGDEYWHFSYSQRMLHEGIIERETVHNYNSPTPFVTLNVALDEYMTKLGITPGFDKFIARIPAVAWYILLLVLSYAAPRYLFSESVTDEGTLQRICCWAAFLTCLDQILLGQGSHIGSDTPFAAMTLIFLMAFEAYRRKPSFGAALTVGLVIGLAFNVKYSAAFLLFFALVGMPLIFFRRLIKSDSLELRNALPVLGHLLGAALLISCVVDAAYGFKEMGLTFSMKQWYSGLFQFLASTFPHVPLPWPLPFVAGFDHQLAVERQWTWSSIVLGREYPSGVWFYFPIVWLLKTPLAILAAVTLGLCFGLTKIRELLKNGPFVLTFCLFVYLLTYFCFVFRTQVGIRYTLMCIPLAYLLLGFILATSLKKAEQIILAVFILLGAGYEIAPYVGNNLSFTNSILADKSQAYAWITDSNIDWFHNYTRARAVAATRVGNYYFNPRHLLQGNNVFTVNMLAGVMRNSSQHAWIRNNLTPSGSFNHTLVWYQADQPTFERFLDESRTYSQPPSAPVMCPPDRVYQPLVNGTSNEFSGTWEKPSLYTACLKVAEPTVIELNVIHGYGAFGNYTIEGSCDVDEAGKGESLWFKLSPGTYPICAKVKEQAQAMWTLHSGQAGLALRNQ